MTHGRRRDDDMASSGAMLALRALRRVCGSGSFAKDALVLRGGGGYATACEACCVPRRGVRFRSTTSTQQQPKPGTSPPPPKPPSEGKAFTNPVGIGSLALLLATAGGVVTYYTYLRDQRNAKVKPLPSVGRADIGGPFTLIGPKGETFSNKTLEGEFALLYFGFTFCPDICPAELEKIAKAVDLVEKATGRKLKPVFITIDPERDTTEQVNEYCAEFHPRMVGLTGSRDAINKVTRAFRVYYTKATDDDDDDDDAYLIDHSIITYLIDPEGNFVKFFGKNATENDMSVTIAAFINQWKGAHAGY